MTETSVGQPVPVFMRVAAASLVRDLYNKFARNYWICFYHVKKFPLYSDCIYSVNCTLIDRLESVSLAQIILVQMAVVEERGGTKSCA